MTDRAAKSFDGTAFEIWLNKSCDKSHLSDMEIIDMENTWMAATKAVEERQKTLCRQCNKSIESDKSRFIGKVSK
jgi:hypothetical protein